jgi:hypothetical protein
MVPSSEVSISDDWRVKVALKSKPEFNFDSDGVANLEGGIAILRIVEALRIDNFLRIALIKPNKNGCSNMSRKKGSLIFDSHDLHRLPTTPRPLAVAHSRTIPRNWTEPLK